MVWVIFSCNNETEIDQTIYYNSDCLDEIGSTLFTSLPIDSFLMKEWSNYVINDTENIIIGFLVQVDYFKNKPVSIQHKYYNWNTSYLVPFIYDSLKYTNINIKYKANVCEIKMYYFDEDVPYSLEGLNYYFYKTICEFGSNKIVAKNYFDDNNYVIVEINNTRKDKSCQYYNSDNTPLSRSDNIHIIKKYYDERGNLIETACFDIDKKPVMADGYAIFRNKYDERGNMIEQSYFDTDKKPVIVDGCAIIRWKYDEKGNRIEQSYFDTDEKPVMADGYAILRWKYDEKGNWIEEAYFDIDKKPVMVDGCAILRKKYDEKGNRIGQAYFDTEDNLIMVDGCAIIRNKYDKKGNEIEQTYFDIEENLVIVDGCAIMKMKYDNRGNLIKRTYFYKKFKPAKSYSKIKYYYNENRKLINKKYSDVPFDIICHSCCVINPTMSID